MVESWRNVSRAATLGEHDFDAGLGHGQLTRPQCMTLLKDAADVVRGLVALDRRYSNIPGWQSLKDAGWLGRAGEACSAYAGLVEPDYTIDRRGWRPRLARVDGPALPGITGVLQAENNLLAELSAFPDARSLRLILDSQRIVSRDAAVLVSRSHPDLADAWKARAGTYLRLIRATRDVGGMLTSREKKALNRNYFNSHLWRPALLRAGVPDLRENGCHALRHFFASTALHEGETIKAVSEYLGHADPGFMLRTYTHLMEGSSERTKRAINTAFLGKPESEGNPDEKVDDDGPK